jgi:hypothetical protein
MIEFPGKSRDREIKEGTGQKPPKILNLSSTPDFDHSRHQLLSILILRCCLPGWSHGSHALIALQINGHRSTR